MRRQCLIYRQIQTHIWARIWTYQIRLKGVSPRKGHPNCSSEFRRIQLVVIGCYQHCFSKERSLTHILHQDVCLFSHNNHRKNQLHESTKTNKQNENLGPKQVVVAHCSVIRGMGGWGVCLLHHVALKLEWNVWVVLVTFSIFCYLYLCFILCLYLRGHVSLIFVINVLQGTGRATKTDEFSEMFQRGDLLQSKKLYCRFCLDLQTGLLSTKLQYDFPKMRG